MTWGSVVEWSGHFASGETSLLERRKTVILNSSQSKRPRGSDAWIPRTSEAVRSLSGTDSVLLCSVDLNTWELPLHLANTVHLPRICLLPAASEEGFLKDCDSIVEEFDLNWSATCFLGFESMGMRRKEAWAERDRIAVELAETLLPVSLRREGRLTALLSDPGIREKVNDGWRIDWASTPPHPAFQLDLETIRKDFDPTFRGWLFHWTRGCDGPWPGERKSEYYSALLSSGEEDFHSAEKTLDRIAAEKRIRGSGWKVRGGECVAAFTDLPPGESEHLFRWRKRYARFTAEPFGVALHPDAAWAAGVRPVTYLTEAEEEAAAVPLHLRQGAGRRGDWPREREHRCRGDLDLSHLPEESWRTVVLPLLPAMGGE